MQLIFSAILAGLCIGIGAAAYCSCSNALVGALLFAAGLSAICAQGFALYTGKIGYARTKKDYQNAAIMFLGNCIGVATIAYIARLAAPSIQIQALSMIEAKNNATIIQKFCSGILCGMCVYLAVDGYKAMNKFLFILLFIPLFIVCAWDHCIANIAYAVFAGKLMRLDLFIAVVLGNSAGALGLNWLSRSMHKITGEVAVNMDTFNKCCIKPTSEFFLTIQPKEEPK